jgi:hypothetical protein
MRLRAIAMVMTLVALVIVTCFPFPVMAQTRSSLTTDQPLYTLRDKQVLLQGDGFVRNGTYTVWLRNPTDNATRATSLTFATTDKGQIPPSISLPIEANATLGTYLVSISNSTKSDAAIARAHYGIWGTDKYVYQRTEIVKAVGGGVLPKASLKVTIRNPAAAFVYDTTIAANQTGAFAATWKIPSDAMPESYTVLIDAVGMYDSPNAEFVSLSKFSVTPALLNVEVNVPPNTSYERTQAASAEFIIRYPDLSEVVTLKDGLKPATLYAGQLKREDLGLAISGTTSGIWTVQYRIPRNASLDVNYKFQMSAKAFDDGKGNTGPGKDVETSSFTVTSATLLVSPTSNSTRYQVPLDTITAYAAVTYPDGTTVNNATVRAWLNASDSKMNATVTRDKTTPVWIIKYAFPWGDLLRLGSWRLNVEATDIYGNSGSSFLEVATEPYTLLEILIVVAAVLLVARWLLSKFWRRLYLEAKRTLSAFRRRPNQPSVGRYFSSSPVTP